MSSEPDRPTPTAAPTPAGPRRRVLLAIVALVVLAHLALLSTWLQPDTPPLPADRQRAAPVNPRPTELGAVTTATPPQTPDQNNKQNVAPPLYSKGVSAINGAPPAPQKAPAKRPAATPDLPVATGQPAEPAPLALAPDAPGGDTTAPSPSLSPPAPNVTPPGALKWPAAAELSYEVQATRKGLSLSAHGVLRWQPSAADYQARMEVKALLFGQRSQTSVGTLDTLGGLQPTRYGDKNRAEQATHFDRTRTPPVLRFSANTPDVQLQPHTQDRLSVLLQLAAMFAGSPGRFAPGDTVALHTAGPRDADVWQFRVGSTSPLTLPAGTLNAVHLVRAPLHAYDNRVELWLAPDLGHLPVRILWTQSNGDVVDQQLASHRPLGDTP